MTVPATTSHELRADAGGVIHVLPAYGGTTGICGAPTPAFGDRSQGDESCVLCFVMLRSSDSQPS